MLLKRLLGRVPSFPVRLFTLSTISQGVIGCVVHRYSSIVMIYVTNTTCKELVNVTWARYSDNVMMYETQALPIIRLSWLTGNGNKHNS
jgi:hypothetical protein